MRKFVAVTLSAAILLSLATFASAATTFKALINSAQENPALPDEGSGGIGTFILNDAMNALSYDIQLFGLDLDGLQTPGTTTDNATRTHIHRAPIGTNGGIVFGQIDANAALRNDLDDVVVDPVLGRITGVWDNAEGNGTTLGAELANLLAGNLYFNVHTADHGGGEVRGQIRLVPEPATMALVALGAIFFGSVMRRRK